MRSADSIVELPKFVVTDSRELPPPESWQFASVPGLEVLSTISQRNTRRFVQDFWRLQQVIEIVWPAVTRGTSALPAALILCGSGSRFESFVPKNDADNAARATSLFLHDRERAAIVVDFVRDTIDSRPISSAALTPISAGDDAAGEETTSGAGFMAENDPYREFYLQYFRSVIRRGAAEAPRWLEEGLVQLLASVQFSKDYIFVGRLQDGAGGQHSSNFTTQLARQPLLDLDLLFAPNPPTDDRAAIYPAQCYALVHLCLYGKKGKYQPALVKLAQRGATEPITEKIFKECFGLSYSEMGVMLRSHISYAAHQYIELRLDKKSALKDPPEFVLREATQAEVGRIKGETYRLGGNNDRAKLALIAPYIRGVHDLPLVAALGLYERAVNHDERARKFLEAAAQGEVQRPRVYLELGRMRFAEAKATVPAGGLLEPATTQAILRLLLAGVRQAPPMPELYELIGEVWARSQSAPTEADLRLLYEGVHRFPRQLRLVYLAAALATRNGEKSNARALIEHGLSVAGSSEAAQHFKALQQDLK
jgi:hypothetical protein